MARIDSYTHMKNRACLRSGCVYVYTYIYTHSYTYIHTPQAEADERVRILMDGMRGRSLNQNDFADEGVTMQVYTHTRTHVDIHNAYAHDCTEHNVCRFGSHCAGLHKDNDANAYTPAHCRARTYTNLHMHAHTYTRTHRRSQREREK